MGLRYRKYAPGLPGKPDIVFTKAKVAVFVDGDYWHGRVIIDHGWKYYEARLQTANRDYWINKMRRNIERDVRVKTELEEAGWMVIRLWESDVKRDLESAAALISRLVDSNRPKPSGDTATHAA
jgi:DNA mismatch endonuclease (patch repair protein)